MKRDLREMTCEGTREELIAELEKTGEGWLAFSKDSNAEDCSIGIERLRDGLDEVTVGHTVYRVTDATPGVSSQ